MDVLLNPQNYLKASNILQDLLKEIMSLKILPAGRVTGPLLLGFLNSQFTLTVPLSKLMQQVETDMNL